MSVSVTIVIAAGAAHRWLEIELQSTPQLDENGLRDPDEFGEYQVAIGNAPIHLTQKMRFANFTHRYGDDVTVLVARAGYAIREKYGAL